MTAFTVASSKRFSTYGIWPCVSNGSYVTFGCCSCSPTTAIPERRSACVLPVAIAAGSSVGCLPRSVASVLLSRGAAGGEIRALAALVMPPRWCTSFLARIRRASCIFPCVLSTSTGKHHQLINEARHFSPCVIVIASLPNTSSIRRLLKRWGDVEKLGSFLKVSDEGFVVRTACWGYL